MDKIKYETIRYLSHVQVASESDSTVLVERRQKEALNRENKYGELAAPVEKKIKMSNRRVPILREGAKVGRNQQCPCRSGKKFKQCCGKI